MVQAGVAGPERWHIIICLSSRRQERWLAGMCMVQAGVAGRERWHIIIIISIICLSSWCMCTGAGRLMCMCWLMWRQASLALSLMVQAGVAGQERGHIIDSPSKQKEVSQPR